MRLSHLPALLLLLPLPAFAQTAEIQQKIDHRLTTLRYLQGLESGDGGFRATARGDAPSLRATSSALRALKYFGGRAANPAGAARFVLSCHDAKTGGFADTPGGKPDVVLTAVGLMAMVELKLPTDKIEKGAIAYLSDNAREFEQIRMAAAGLETIGRPAPKKDAWLQRLAEMQNADGSFGSGAARVRDTGGAVACLLRLGGKVKNADALVRLLDAGQRDDGGFAGASGASDLETSYRVVRSYVMLGARPKRADDLRRFIARCRNADGSYGVSPGKPGAIGPTYFAAILLHWLDKR